MKDTRKHKFNEPPTLINGWEDFVGLENDNYYIDINLEMGCGWVRCKREVPDFEYYTHNMYLSTHTFYGDQYQMYTSMLRDFGFNVQLKNWDGETIYE